MRARFRCRGRGTGASKGDSPLARRANSWISGGRRNLGAQWSSYICSTQITGPKHRTILTISHASNSDFGFRHSKTCRALIVMASTMTIRASWERMKTKTYITRRKTLDPVRPSSNNTDIENAPHLRGLRIPGREASGCLFAIHFYPLRNDSEKKRPTLSIQNTKIYSEDAEMFNRKSRWRKSSRDLIALMEGPSSVGLNAICLKLQGWLWPHHR